MESKETKIVNIDGKKVIQSILSIEATEENLTRQLGRFEDEIYHCEENIRNLIKRLEYLQKSKIEVEKELGEKGELTGGKLVEKFQEITSIH